jgi:hypothetical protein
LRVRIEKTEDGIISKDSVFIEIDREYPSISIGEVDSSKDVTLSFGEGVSVSIPKHTLDTTDDALNEWIEAFDAEGMRLSEDEVLSKISSANKKIEGEESLCGLFSIRDSDTIDAVYKFVAYDDGHRVIDVFPDGARARVTLPYPDEDEDGLVDGLDLSPKHLSVWRLDEEKSKWVDVGGELKTENKTVTSEWFELVDRFGVFTLIATYPTPSGKIDKAKVRVYPNPFEPAKAKDGLVKFMNIDDDTATIRIYTITGELVTTLDSPNQEHGYTDEDGKTFWGITWDGENDYGRPVASGVYFCVIDADSLKSPIIRKLAVIR